MNKKTQMYLGGAVLLAAAYYFWHKSQVTTTPKANAVGGYEYGTPCSFESLKTGKTTMGKMNENGCQASNGDSRRAFRPLK